MSDSDSTPELDKRQPLIPCHDALHHFDLWNWLDCCPKSQTMTAWDTVWNAWLVFALPCNQWSCRHCAVRKTRSLAHKTERAKPNRLLTLTVDPKLHANPRGAFDDTRRKIPDLVKYLRSRFGELEYLRVTELTKKGWPHYHFLLRSKFLPHDVVRDHWYALTGAAIVDLRQVKQSFGCYQYLLKYLTKLHKLTWTGRHVSYSRGFFMPSDDPTYEPHQLLEREVHNEHPSHYIMEYHSGQQVMKLAPRTFHFTSPDDPPPPVDATPQEQCQLFPKRPRFDADGFV